MPARRSRCGLAVIVTFSNQIPRVLATEGMITGKLTNEKGTIIGRRQNMKLGLGV